MKRIIIILLSVLCIMCLDYKVMAEPSIENDLYGVEQYGLVKKRSSLWNSIEINLYPEFENTQDAIKNFITINSSILFEIESKIGMKIIDVDSFFDFLEMYSLYIEENELYESRPEEMLFRKELLNFTDIIENEEKNTERLFIELWELLRYFSIFLFP